MVSPALQLYVVPVAACALCMEDTNDRCCQAGGVCLLTCVLFAVALNSSKKY